MPLIVMCGYPSSCKSTVALQLRDFLQNDKGRRVWIVREDEWFRGEKNAIVDDSRKEKEVRGKLKSEAQRLLNKEDVVIVDGLNYIKGYRYELFCLSKGVPTRQITVHTVVGPETAWEFNTGRPEVEQYDRGVFDRLISRFELPDSSNRWDSPYFPVLISKEKDDGFNLQFNDIYHKLYGISPPKPNLSTVNKPITESSSISSMEKVTSDIVKAILDAKDPEEITVPHSELKVNKSSAMVVNLAQLTKFKRQYLNLMKSGSVKGNTGDLFVQYINSQLT